MYIGHQHRQRDVSNLIFIVIIVIIVGIIIVVVVVVVVVVIIVVVYLGGGYITLVMALGVKPRLGILKAIRNWEKGIHTPEIDIIKAEAFRFKPQDRDGVYSIDGEMFPVQNFQAQILKQLGRIMCKKRKEHTSALTPQSGSVIS